MSKTSWTRELLLVVVLTCVGTGCMFLYQHHLSGDVEHLLIAANDEHATEAERQQYEAQARPLVRTQRDKEVFGEYEEAMSLIAKAEYDRQYAMADHIYEDTASITNEPDKAEHLAAIKARRDRFTTNGEQGIAKLNDVRKAIGLAPLPTY